MQLIIIRDIEYADIRVATQISILGLLRDIYAEQKVAFSR